MAHAQVMRYDDACTIVFMNEMRKRIHNLKYYTWVEQQGKTYEEINAQWYDPNYWTEIQSQVPEIDALINDFNERVGLIKEL